jgi:hypothetical protein
MTAVEVFKFSLCEDAYEGPRDSNYMGQVWKMEELISLGMQDTQT